MSKKSNEGRARAGMARPSAGLSRRAGPRVAGLNAVAAAVAGILYCAGGAYAADETPAASDEGNALNEIVVTASAQGVKKLDASYNIVSLSLDDIKNSNPASVADIFKLSPGIWPEASGGQTGVNIDVAGFPNGGGDSPYFTTMIQGSPVYGSPFLSFMDNSSFIRLDDTVERVEIVQGGTSAIFGPGQEGATANFILRTGKDKSEGSFAATYGFEGLYRADLFQSGKIADGWYGSIGGFYRTSNGVRDPQYPSDQGGQLTATLKHDLDNGSVMFWARTMHDHNQWVADFPYTVQNGNVSTYPGFNQLHSTWNSYQLQNFLIPNPGCGQTPHCFQNDNISDGRGGDLSFVGSELKMSLGNGWSISNNFLFDGGYVNTHAMINNGNPSTLSAFIAGLGTLGGTPVTPADVQAMYPSGTPVDPNQSVEALQTWTVLKKLTSITDEFRAIKELFDGNNLTAGVYVNHYTMNDQWSLGANALVTNVPNAAPIILTANVGGVPYQVSSPQGIYNANGGYQILQDGNATQVAAYLSDSWKIDRWLLDASVRLAHISLSQETSNLAATNLNGGAPKTGTILWDNNVAMPDGTYSHGSANNTMPTFSGGANYEFNDNMSAYGRINNGHSFDVFDDVRCQNYEGGNSCPSHVPQSSIQNYEVGFKIQNKWMYIDLSGYDKEFSGLAYTPTDINGVPIGPATTYGSTALGVRLNGSVSPFAASDNQMLSSFRIGINAIAEHAYYKDFKGCAIYTDINNVVQCGTINGQQLARLPKSRVYLTPQDTQVFSWGTLTELVTYEHIGQHYQDNTGLLPLHSYYDMGFGIDAMIGESWELRLLGSNITNQIGLTEGNARFGGNTVQNNVGMGRSIEGREVNMTVKYRW
ncbi:MAG TPA: TonB-dependent receptor plug domain-containing protein [Steroidobacteraceae bacterium]|nr:TonB-dependent receptor plug domain-containing protein [Steroidobacteraceae bacterium]